MISIYITNYPVFLNDKGLGIAVVYESDYDLELARLDEEQLITSNQQDDDIDYFFDFQTLEEVKQQVNVEDLKTALELAIINFRSVPQTGV